MMRLLAILPIFMVLIPLCQLSEITAESYSPYGELSDSVEEMLNGGRKGFDRFIVSVTSLCGDVEERIERAGFDIMGPFPAADAYLVCGRWEDIGELQNTPGVIYIEWDSPVELDLEVSTGVINASDVWYSLIEQSAGVYEPGSIDGKGVTIVVVDTGIDAGHPDLEYGGKTIMNLKADTPFGPWIPMENSDTSYGHGTHCAGIAAGSGVASAGARRGVAPGANLIGLSVGDVGIEDLSMSNYLGGLQWVYDHSRPGSNIYNIRVVTNSWHTSVGEYDPSSALTRIVERLTFENNVVVCFSAGNDGRLDPEGDTVTTSQQGNTPVAIMVAAYARDGSYVADFSSRGKVGMPQTYPDVGAPGVRIWAPQARRTIISAGSWLSNTNPYYLPLSGTSMSTPHVAGAVALLFQACPSLRVSEIHEDYAGGELQSWLSNPLTRVHEAEIILEASSRRLPEDEEHGVPVKDTATGWGGQRIDYVQGYGIIDLKAAVGIALTLNRLRTLYGPQIDVLQAITIYRETVREGVPLSSPATLYTQWEGVWTRYNQQAGKDELVQNQTREVYIPRGVRSVNLILDYEPYSVSNLKVGYITYVVDYNMDGEWDLRGPLMDFRGGFKEYTIEVREGQDGRLWRFGIVGEGIQVVRPLTENSYVEMKIAYRIRLTVMWPGHPREMYLERVNRTGVVSVWMPETPGGEGDLAENLTVYSLWRVRLPGEGEVPSEGRDYGLLLIALLLILPLAAIYIRWRRRRLIFSSSRTFKKGFK